MVDSISRPISQQTPPLESGDRLDRYEFERRYNAMPNLRKAELIEGVVYMPAALRFKSHGKPHGDIMGWLWTYKVFTAGVELGDAPTIRLDLDNEPQPDAVLMIEEEYGGQACLSDDDYIEGAPEFVAEIAASSVAIDVGKKLRSYRRNGIKEYLVWQVFDQKLDWFYLDNGQYKSLPIDSDGIIRSQVFPGLWLSARDLLTGNMRQVLSVLQDGLASEDHAAFVHKLSQQAKAND